LVFSSTTAGNLLVVLIQWSDSGGTNPTMPAGWTSAGAKITNAGNSSLHAFYDPNNPGGITSVQPSSWDNGTPGDISIAGSEYSGIATSSPLIVLASQSQASPGTGTDAVTSGTGNVTSQPALIWGCVLGAGTSYVAGTGFTQRSAWGFSCVEDKRVTATGNQAATFTAAGSASNVQTAMLAFAEAGAGGSNANLLSGKFGMLLKGKL
jgi:hypothetical protein